MEMEKRKLLKISMQFFAEPASNDDDDPKPNEGNEPSDDNNSKPNENEPKPEKTFTQDQVSKMMAKEKNQGRNSVYKELGIDPKDAKQLESLKNYIESQKTDAQKAAEKALLDNKAIEEANQRARVAEIKAEVLMLGIKPQYAEDAVTLALSKTSDEETDVKSILAEFKTKYPVWFDDSQNSKGGKGTGSSLKGANANKNKEDGKPINGIGARLAANRKSQKKNSYWS